MSQQVKHVALPYEVVVEVLKHLAAESPVAALYQKVAGALPVNLTSEQSEEVKSETPTN